MRDLKGGEEGRGREEREERGRELKREKRER
jgi:hypothetical protein